MLENGYSLARVEMLNWGNFHGLQKFDLRAESDAGPLFSPPPAAAILGINGSGKSTLIDGLMMVLLPFENSLKLGVTNDVETGSAGGRTVRDYVLGKYSSTGDQQVENPGDIYGRQDGCSIFLTVFRHNRQPDRFISLGRAWWYQKGKVQESQLAFLHYDRLTIEELCPLNQIPRHAKAFREHVRQNLSGLQVHETMQSYFMAMSASLGQVSRDDLKILNRAFYVKSISQIDTFIRENMLLEKDSPHLERLLENVRNGKEIAFSIQLCEEKLVAISRILKDLDRMSEIEEERGALQIRRKLVGIYPFWQELRQNREQLRILEHEVDLLTRRHPELREKLDLCQREHGSLLTLLHQNDVEARAREIASELTLLSEKIKNLRTQRQVAEDLCADLPDKLPTKSENWSDFLEKVRGMQATLYAELTEAGVRTEQAREGKYQVDQAVKLVREELDHLSKTRTLLPRELYRIKDEACRDLGIAPENLRFVGELLQVGSNHQGNRRAIESVLFPISRNLLCHPDDLVSLTKWLNERGLQSDLTVKRISHEELSSKIEFPPTSPDRILEMLEMLPASEHPFHSYLWRWLLDVFDYRLVDVARFKKEEGQVVTPEGTVKTDRRTMRKLKQSMAFSLGWDNADRIETLAQELTGLNQRLAQFKDEIRVLEEQTKKNDLLVSRLSLLQKVSPDFLALPHLEKTAEQWKRAKERLDLENPDYQKLKTTVHQKAQELEEIRRTVFNNENDTAAKTELREKITNLLPRREKELLESPYHEQLLKHFGDINLIEAALTEMDQDILKSGATHLRLASDLEGKIVSLNGKRDKILADTAKSLSIYQRNHQDPDLPYDLNMTHPTDFLREWRAHKDRLERSELPEAREKWKNFFDQILMDSVKDTINEIKSKVHEIEKSIVSINDVLKLTNFESLPTEQRYLQIDIQSSTDERIRKFRRQTLEVEKLLGTAVRSQVETSSTEIMETLVPFVEGLQNDSPFRVFVTDVRNYFQFRVFSRRRSLSGEDSLAEIFTGSRKDAKSSAQTTQLAYTLLASCLAYRFKFHDPVGGQDTPRLLILDEFGGKFDNEKPREVLKLLDQMGFQSILVSPMSKAELLAESISQLVLVHKVSASQSKVQSYPLTSKRDYDLLLQKEGAGARA
jgi:uncharacterized protein YPO0396